MEEELLTLARYRLTEARDCIEEARLLLNEAKTRGAMNRVYYTMFYSILALLATKQLSASKHSGAIGLFHKEFVKSGIFPKDLAKFLDVSFDLRIKSDYRDFVTIEKAQVEELLQKSIQFLKETEQLIDKLSTGR